MNFIRTFEVLSIAITLVIIIIFTPTIDIVKFLIYLASLYVITDIANKKLNLNSPPQEK